MIKLDRQVMQSSQSLQFLLSFSLLWGFLCHTPTHLWGLLRVVINKVYIKASVPKTKWSWWDCSLSFVGSHHHNIHKSTQLWFLHVNFPLMFHSFWIDFRETGLDPFSTRTLILPTLRFKKWRIVDIYVYFFIIEGIITL